MILHAPWIGNCYEKGIASRPGERIAIVGHSHHSNKKDHRNLTICTVKAVIAGKQRHSFFTRIPSWFGVANLANFYESIMFFNFLPCCVGNKEQKYERGTFEQIEAARKRFKELVSLHKPDRVFVFTTKGWKAFPESDRESAGLGCIPLVGNFPASFNWDTYTIEGHKVTVIGLRHPQHANNAVMRRAVEAGLAVPLLET